MTEESLGKWFLAVTKPQLAAYNQRMADAAPYRNSPRWSRERAAAHQQFEQSTSEARTLYERGIADLNALGELSEATEFAITQFKVGQIMEAAE